MATQDQINDFITRIAPIIQKYSHQYGYKVSSPIIAQACLESRYGQSGLAKYHNYFGLKCGKSWKGMSVSMSTKEEYVHGALTTIRDSFRVYSNLEEGVKGYFDFISTSRYANLKTATDPKQYLEMIKADGYATSSKYVENNMAVVNKHNLAKYDTTSGYLIGQNYTLQSDMYVRQSPNGAKIKYDSLTEDGKKNGKFDEEGNAILFAGTRVTCKGMSGKWMQIPSGWVCTVSNTGKTYII